MFRFEWQDLVLPELLQELAALAGAPANIVTDALTPPLAALLRATGGLPLARSDWDARHRTQVARTLLHEATTALLRRRYGFVGADAGRVDANHATAADLEALPVLGPTLAGRIVESRRRDGAFESAQHLTLRIEGVGPAGAQRLDQVLAFGDGGRPAAQGIHGTFDEDVRAALRLRTGASPLADLIEELAVFAASEPHPATVAQCKRDDLEPEMLGRLPALPLEAERVDVLSDRAYVDALPALLESAEQEILVCMFFIALGGEDHPTRRLLDALVSRRAAGCRVRVLVDQDRVGDPYGSRLVNAQAAHFLSSGGIAVHHDRAKTLLHSKFVVVDSSSVVIGSHNWTAGSFATYRDASLLLRGARVALEWRERFDALWEASRPFVQPVVS